MEMQTKDIATRYSVYNQDTMSHGGEHNIKKQNTTVNSKRNLKGGVFKH